MTTTPFVISREFNAPRKLVWLAHTDAAHMSRWYTPAGAKVIHMSLDLRPGGVYHYGLRFPDGGEMWGKQLYREIVPYEKIIHLQAFSDAAGGISRHPMAPTWPALMHATTTFEDAGDNRTRLTVSWSPFEASPEEIATFDAARANMSGGFAGTFAQLDAWFEATATALMHSRWLPAPREVVWDALTDPAKVNVWWGPDGFHNVDVTQDVRVGGVWSFTMIGPDGTRYANHAVYREVTAPERLVYDHGDGATVMFRAEIELTEESGGTRVTLRLTLPDRASRDAVVPYAIDGGQQTLAKLEAFVRSSPVAT